MQRMNDPGSHKEKNSSTHRLRSRPHRNSRQAHRLDSLVDGVYSAILDPGQWSVFLGDLADALGGTLPTLFRHDSRNHSGSFGHSVGYEPQVVRDYRERFAGENVWLRGARPHLIPGRVRLSHMMCSRHELLQSQFWADFCRPLGVSNAIGATILKHGSVTFNVTVMASKAKAEFTSEDARILGRVVPHLQRALQVHQRMAHSTIRLEGLQQSLERLPTGVILLNASGKVLFVNEAARTLVASRDGLVVDATGLRALRADETRRLRLLICNAAKSSAGSGVSPGGSMRVTRAKSSPLEVLVSPLHTAESWYLPERIVAAVYVTDPSQRVAAAETTMRQLYGLTDRETDVLAAVTRGQSARQAARELEISYNTIKTHLRHIFLKTETASQADLIRLASRDLANLRTFRRE
jgi:DNA-binding NarL/FixJ family response regulator